MLCEKCKKNEATFYYHENNNGKTKTYKLCADCAKELEKSGEIESVNTDKIFDSFFEEFANPFKSMDKLFSGFFGENTGLIGSRSQTEEKKCQTCGMTLREFAESGMAGCPDCYAAFEKELAPTISRAQGKTAHVGHAPHGMREKIEAKHRIDALEKERAEAVKNENYERAAEIRDELRRLRGDNG